MKKRIVTIVLAAALVLSSLTACGSSSSDSSTGSSDSTVTETTETETGSTETAEAESGYVYTGEAPVTTDADASLKILASTSNYTTVDIEHAEIVELVVEQSGVNVEWQLIDYNNYSDSVGPMLTTGNVDADIIKLPDLDTNQTYLKSGLFVAIDEYFDVMPNYSAWLDANPVIKASLTAADGHIYYVPTTTVGHDYQPVMMINQVWLDKAGVDAPETLDEFVELLRYFRDNDMNGNGDTTDEIPMSMMASMLPYAFGPAFGLDLVSGFAGDEDGTVYFAPAETEKYYAYLEFVHSLYEEGLLEIEYTSLDRDQIVERISNDLTGITYDFSWQMSMLYSPSLPYYDGTADTAFVGVAPLSGEYEGFYVGRTEIGGVFGVNSSSDDIELACKFLDYAMSDACQDLYQWGIEGESWEYDASGERVFTEQASDNDWLQQLGINPAFVYPAQQSVASTDALVADWHAEVNAWQYQFVVDPWPFIYSSDEEAEVISTYYVDIETYVDENATQFITGTKSLDKFDSYISGLDALNLSAVLEVKQAQYDRYLSAME